MRLCLYEVGLYNINKKHLKNVGPIRHCEPPHADVHNNSNDDDEDNDNT